jgi:hypothetical protein
MPDSTPVACEGLPELANNPSQSDGPPSFQMEFHLPFFALRNGNKSGDLSSAGSRHRLRKWENLTLLRQDQTGSDSQQSYCLEESQLSCIVHGFDEWNWTCYAFEDNRKESDAEDEVDQVPDLQVGSGDITFDVDDEDPILLLLDSRKQPIWKPRQYFLKAFEVQVRKFWTEWNALVYRLEDDRIEYVGLFT